MHFEQSRDRDGAAARAGSGTTVDLHGGKKVAFFLVRELGGSCAI